MKEEDKNFGTLKIKLQCYDYGDYGDYGHISTDCGNLKTRSRRGKSKAYSYSESEESSSSSERCERNHTAFLTLHDNNLKALTTHSSLKVNNEDASSNDDCHESTSGKSFNEEIQELK